MNKIISASLYVLLISFNANGQRTPCTNAILLPDSLVFNGLTSVTNVTVTYNPVALKYYSARMGSSTYPLQTWNSSGGLAIHMDTVGIDTRGIWWNPNTNQVERNSFNSIGWSTVNLNASQNATKNFTMLFTGMLQPNVQSAGAYDYLTNTVLFYNSGAVSIYNRNTGTLISTMPLTGAALTSISPYSIIYTGEAGYEIGILDNVAKKVLLFNRSTGVFSGSSQLPASAITTSQFNFSYANFRVWLFNSSLKKWNAYNIWNSMLPVKLLSFSSSLKDETKVECNWTTATEVNNDYFTIERSKDAVNFEQVEIINGAGNSTQVLDYYYNDENPFTGISYYRLKQTDFDGRFTYSQTVAVKMINTKDIVPYPNPASEKVHLIFNSAAETSYEIRIVNIQGKICAQQAGLQTIGANTIEVNTANLEQGIYNLLFVEDEKVIAKLITIN